MAAYKIAWLPGDGVGNDVMEAARMVLDALKLDAQYIPGDIGWEFWCHEGNALPDRTIELMELADRLIEPADFSTLLLVGDLRGNISVMFSQALGSYPAAVPPDIEHGRIEGHPVHPGREFGITPKRWV